jgi:hypothetical protein
MPPLLSFSSLQLAAVIDAARPLHSSQRGEFLREVAAILCGRRVDNEAVSRAVRDAQSEFR